MVLGLAASILFLAAAAPSPGAARPEIAACVRQLEKGAFEGALATFQAAVARMRSVDAAPAELALSYHYLGVASLGISEEIRARTEFLQKMRGEPPRPREENPLPEITPERRPTGRLQVVVRPWAEVAIDGVDVGLTPLGRLRLAPGRHAVRVTHPASEELERPVTVTAGETAKPVIDLT